MQVIIEEVVSRIRATSSEAALSQQTLGVIISAVMDAIEVEKHRANQLDEETSMLNHHERVQSGR